MGFEQIESSRRMRETEGDKSETSSKMVYTDEESVIVEETEVETKY
jgi:hypothetical protein